MRQPRKLKSFHRVEWCIEAEENMLQYVHDMTEPWYAARYRVRIFAFVKSRLEATKGQIVHVTWVIRRVRWKRGLR